MKIPKKLFVVRKYVMAKDCAEAITLERKVAVEDVYIDDEWKKAHVDEVSGNMGFKKSKAKQQQ